MAPPTSECVIQIAIEELPITLHCAKILVIGAGRLGKVLIQQFRGLGVLVICPCTGNTPGKLANGITDTTVTLAAKAISVTASLLFWPYPPTTPWKKTAPASGARARRIKIYRKPLSFRRAAFLWNIVNKNVGDLF